MHRACCAPQLPTGGRGGGEHFLGQSCYGHARRQGAARGHHLLPLPSAHRHIHTRACGALQSPGHGRAPASVLISHRALDVLKDFAPGAQLPVLLYNGEPKTDTVTIEDFLEDKLGPPTSVAGTALRWGKEPKRGRTGWGEGAGSTWACRPLPPSSAAPVSLQVPQPGSTVQGIEPSWQRHLPQVLHLHQEPSACPGRG